MAFSGAFVYKSAGLTGQNVTSGGLMVYSSEVYDTDSWHDTGSNTGRLTVPSGVTNAAFLCSVAVDNVTANVSYTIQIYKNGAALTQNARVDDTTNHTSIRAQVFTGPLAVTAGDYFEVHVTIGTDTSVDFIADANWFAGWKTPAAPATFSGAVARKSADQSAADYSAGAVITFDTDHYDVGGWHDTGSDTSRMTVPSGVTYVQLQSQVAVQAFTATQWARATIYKNGATLSRPNEVNHSHGTATILRWSQMTPPLSVTAGDYFEVHLQTQTDASITVTAARTWLSIRKVA